MKDSLEKFVQQNREAFDDQMLPENSWNRIENALPKVSKQIFWNSVSLWRASAIIFFGLSAYLLVSKNYSRPNKQEIAEIQGFNDLENFYSSQITEKMDMVHRYQSSTGLTEDVINQQLNKLDKPDTDKMTEKRIQS